ncbi:MAG: DUF2254 domain-containing protein [Myxococcales bacterium]|nr:DUF2254 domain-containing protein [Myxococcales bacterium]
MAAEQPQQDRRRVWVYPVLLLGGIALAWFALLVAVHAWLGPKGVGFWATITGYRASDMQSALGNLPEVVVAILGIAITVVSIVLQLSATRYTPRVTEMFFRDRTNLLVLSFFVITSIHCIWSTFVVHSQFVPHVLIGVTVAMMTASILVLIPYFVYVFAFLDPERIVMRLQEQALADAVGDRRERRTVDDRQASVLNGIEQLADVAINSVQNKDRIIASRTVDALKDLAVNYTERKRELDESWFVIGGGLMRNPDFTVMAEQSVEALSAGHTWLEFAALRQYQTIYIECLNGMRDINQLVAINTRYMAEAAIRCGDHPMLQLAIKFFNTYLRAAINAKDVRTAYNTLHQYRQLAEAVLHAGWNDEVIDLAQHFKYYGQTANIRGLSFVTETAAYDMCRLCEVAHEVKSVNEWSLLETFLEVDKAPETESEERSLRGVRKAQIKLATYYLDVGADELARLIFEDMADEPLTRLISIREEILAVENKDFWEIIDRGDNLDYLEPSRRRKLMVFYSWFPELRPSVDEEDEPPPQARAAINT